MTSAGDSGWTLTSVYLQLSTVIPESRTKQSYAWIPDHYFVVSGMTVIAFFKDHLPVALPNCLSYTVSPKPQVTQDL